MFFRIQTLIAVVLLIIGSAGCKSTESDQKKVVQADQESAAVQSQQMPEREYGAGLDIKGPVLETMDVGGYTYVQIDDDQGPTWVAIPQQKVEKGQEVSITEGMEMRNFESKTLNRTFDVIYFSAGFEGDKEKVSPHAGIPGAPDVAETAEEMGNEEPMQVSPHAGVPGAPEVADSAGGGSFEDALKAEAGSTPAMVDPSQLSGGSTAARAPAAEDIKVEKADGENAYTVGELFDKGKELDNQDVKVRGKVVKVSTMIMGKNWVHIQDGTSDAAGVNNDLVVTTMAEPEKGSVVQVNGTLHADRDFGAGYHYDVIIEDADVK